jgi:hypothetical protein
MRLYNSHVASLAGVQMKFVATGTWACDDCWRDFVQIREVSKAADQRP